MAAGRCVGCGKTDSEKKIQHHVLSCAAYLERYRANPAQCPDPVTALAQHRSANTSELRASLRDERLRARFAALDAHLIRHRQRWQTPADILDD